MLLHHNPALSVRIDPPACPQIKAWLGREAIQNSKKDDKSQDLVVDNHLFRGGGNVSGNFCVQPELKEWIAAELAKESAILKERRKAREERNSRAPKK